MRRLLVLVAVLTASACASGPRATLEPLREAAASVEAGASDASALSLAGWNAHLDGEAAAAAELAERALQQDPGEPWALFLQADLAGRRLDPAAEARTLLELVERSPDHPLALVAAGRLSRFPHRDPAIDDLLAERLQALLDEGRVAPEVRTRARGVLRVLRAARGLEASAPLVEQSGLITAGTVVGPFSRYRNLEAGKAFAPEARAPVPEAFGELPLRPFSFPEGTISLRGEASDGDVHYVLTVAEVPQAGRYALRLATSSPTSAAVTVDGVPVVERMALDGDATQVAQAIDLDAGEHLIAVRVVRGHGGGDAWVALAPLDGSPSQVAFRAAVPGDRPGSPPDLVDSTQLRLAGDPAALAERLVREGGVVALYAAALDVSHREEEAARELLDRALAHAPGALPLLALRAELTASAESLPRKIAQARAAADWEAVLERDPGHARSLLAGAGMLAEAGRHEEALARLDAVEEAAAGSSSPMLARARVARSRGFEAEARALALALTKEGADRCAGWDLLHDLARRVDAVPEVDRAVEALAACGDGRTRLASHLAARGKLDEAIGVARQLLAEDPQSTGHAYRLADLLVGAGRLQEAVEILERQEAYWPRNAWLPRRRAELLERLGDRAAAQAARNHALALQGSDLALLRMAALERGGEVLPFADRDAFEVIRAFEQEPRAFDTPAVMLLDLGAVEVYPDGSRIEKIHTVARVLDKRGVEQFGEIHLPRGAHLVHLRTIKPDGRVLVPEAIEGKDSISMPGLSVGDYVELEYLVAHGARSPALPGWSAEPFYFRSVGVPLLESIYMVRAHRDAGVELDVHNGMEGVAIGEEGEWKTLTLRRTNAPALIPEPGAPARKEYLPWAQVGAGADERAIFPFFADNLAGSARPTLEVRRWARQVQESVGGKDGLALIRALYDRAMEDIEGSERGYGSTAAQILASGRGNRLLLLRAAFEELGLESRYAAIRPFAADPDPYRFPAPQRWGHLALVVRPEPGAPWIWLDPGLRWAPFGELAPAAQGATAWLLPEPGHTTPHRTSTPVYEEAKGRDTDLRLELQQDGTLVGVGVERYLGFDGAAARAGLEQVDDARRRQMIESSLARIFPGLTLDSVETESEPSGFAVRYRFTVPGFARELGEGRLLLRLDVFQANLGKRFLTRSLRETPLLVDPGERAQVDLQLELPEGATLVRGVEAAREHGPFGDYKRDVAVDGSTVGIRETLDLHRNRVEPAAYPDFASWVAAVDRAQSVELVIER